jgi:hypothetical protein
MGQETFPWNIALFFRKYFKNILISTSYAELEMLKHIWVFSIVMKVEGIEDHYEEPLNNCFGSISHY